MKILSFHLSKPGKMEWGEKSVRSSMVKPSVPGPLVVHTDRIEGNTFAVPKYHGTPDSVLYVFGQASAQKYADALGIGQYPAGLTGETIFLDEFNEDEVSVGDVFAFGEVHAQAVYPRIPCNRLNFRLQNPRAQALMKECGHSGVYFRILKPGKIQLTDSVKLVKKAKHRFSIARLYQIMANKAEMTDEEKRSALANGAFRQEDLQEWAAELGEKA